MAAGEEVLESQRIGGIADPLHRFPRAPGPSPGAALLPQALPQTGPAHLAAAAVHEEHQVVGAELAAEILNQPQEAPVTAAPQPFV